MGDTIALPAEETCGRTSGIGRSTFEVSQFRLGRRFLLPAHAHERPSVAIVLEGALELEHDGAVDRIPPGTACVIPGDLVHRERAAGTSVRCLLLVGRERSAEVAAGGPPTISAAVTTLAHCLAEALAIADDLSLDAAATELLAIAKLDRIRAAAGSTGGPAWIGRIVECLNDTFRSPPALGELAAEAGISPEHLARTFRKATGLTVGQYARRLRVLEGARRLRTSRDGLPEVAYACGYADQSHFTRQFRGALGVTPGQYRRLSRPGIDPAVPSGGTSR